MDFWDSLVFFVPHPLSGRGGECLKAAGRQVPSKKVGSYGVIAKPEDKKLPWPKERVGR